MAPSASATGYALAALHSFPGSGGDGTNPSGAVLIIDVNSNLYGTTPTGGASGLGTVFELVNSSGTYSEKVLHSFTGGANRGYPSGVLLIDASGNLYSTTASGGAGGLGTVFEPVDSSGAYSETVLHSFTGPPTGRYLTGATTFIAIHRIREKDILTFLRSHPQEINRSKMDQAWFLNLVSLSGREVPTAKLSVNHVAAEDDSAA